MNGPRARGRGRIRGGAAPVTLLALASAMVAGAAAGLLPGAWPAGQAADGVRMDGPYGLWVRFAGDTVRVSWLTREPGPGFLQVLAGDRVLHDLTTPDDGSHTASFRRPRQNALVLRYGGLHDPDDRHETAVHLDAGRRRPDVTFSRVDSLYVMGDVHGELDTLLRVLRNAGLVGPDRRWTGGRAHLVLLGDIMDRGADVLPVLWLLHGLEEQARADGGRLHVVLGNHEVMVMLGDLRYVAPREALVARLHGTPYDRMFDPRHSLLGRWLASKPAAIRVNDVLMAHGGVSPAYGGASLRALDDSLAAYVREDLFHRWTDSTYAIPLDSASLERRLDFFWGEEGVLWYRGYARSDTLGDVLRSVLRNQRASVHVVAHTPGPTIRQAYGDSLVAVNTLQFASEMLLMVRTPDGWARYRIREEGPPEPL